MKNESRILDEEGYIASGVNKGIHYSKLRIGSLCSYNGMRLAEPDRTLIKNELKKRNIKLKEESLPSYPPKFFDMVMISDINLIINHLINTQKYSWGGGLVNECIYQLGIVSPKGPWDKWTALLCSRENLIEATKVAEKEGKIIPIDKYPRFLNQKRYDIAQSPDCSLEG